MGGSIAWRDSGAACGLPSRAVRDMPRPAEFRGDVVLLGATCDVGKAGWTRNRPSFVGLCIGRDLLNPQLELPDGPPFNRWSGAYAVQTTPGALGRWNSMFNVDWGGVDAKGLANPGYAAR